MAAEDIDIIETKQLYSRIHSHRKMHRAFKTFNEKPIAHATFKNQKYGHLDTVSNEMHIVQYNSRLCSILLSGKIAALPLKQSNYQFHYVEAFLLFCCRVLTKCIL
ncbi:hypothetical protein T07_14796 [Trichinella nelsoni]|uniref:Uncharacterized protein n=1 Tax=Trichinella nelsoni TaxID=6336 RepID=A0A0V0SDD9_9BILA|nr:hypothetical protein T07_14796 [Trichinella nelsoni]